MGDSTLLFYQVVRHILVGAEPRVFDELYHKGMSQLQFSIKKLTQDLVHMGFSPKYALRTAQQIAPKPVIYSLLVGWRSGLASHYSPSEFYAQVAPEFTAFLFDQTIDEYNINYREHTAVQRMVDEAAIQLHKEPDYYQFRVSLLLDLCFDAEQPVVPSSLAGLGLLVPYIQRLQYLGHDYEDVRHVLYTIADVLTNEHLAQLAHSQPTQSFRRYWDFIDSMLRTREVVIDNAAQTLARASLRGQGFLMVATSQYILRGAHQPILNPVLVRFIRAMEAVVRLYDDIGDLETDQQTQSPNILIASPETQRAFFALSGLSHLLWMETIAMGDRKTLFAQIVEFEEASVQQLRTCQQSAFVQNISDVVYGARINGLYNDRAAEAIGADLTHK